jgi:phosphoribosyl-ATP pyrophosphohydrolase/phosphoribosyl-AMP cyclohydrolase
MLKFDRDGLIPAIVQDESTRQVLMVAYMDAEAIRRTVESGDAWFWSRSRQEYWHKGDTSGNFQHLAKLSVDCDGDAILLEVHPEGPACHTGAVSCFFQTLQEAQAASAAGGELAPAPTFGTEVIDELAAVIAQRHRDKPEGSYVSKLIESGIDRVAKKVGEESAETVIAAMKGDHDEIVWEVADLWFHSLVLLEASGVSPADVYAELAKRRK